MEDSRLSRCYVELAVALIQDCEYEDAIEKLSRGMAIKDHIGSFSALGFANLGLVYTFQGLHDFAEKALSTALWKQRSLFGEMDNVSFR